MLKELLPNNINNALEHININKVYELRLRRNAPIVINYGGENRILKVADNLSEPIYTNSSTLEYVLKKATENSLYAFNNQIKQGFITARGGIRLGIAGESVNSDNFMPTTIKNINSINIRMPHEIIGCAAIAFKYIFNKESGVKNTLIISPPGAGKTTFLRDIARLLSENNEKILNTLIVDERFEICSTVDGSPMLNVGEFSDIVSGASKMFAFTNGIRALKPDVIITDELFGEEDINACVRAIGSGVKVIASVHASSHIELLGKKEFKELLGLKYFERIIVLSNKSGPGTYQGIYDQNLNCIYF